MQSAEQSSEREERSGVRPHIRPVYEDGVFGQIRKLTHGFRTGLMLVLGAVAGAGTGASCAHSPEQKSAQACEGINLKAKHRMGPKRALIENGKKWWGNNEGLRNQYCKEQQEIFQEMLKEVLACQDVETQLRGYENLGVIAELCVDDDTRASMYYQKGLALAASRHFRQDPPLVHNIQRSLMRLASRTEACSDKNIGPNPDGCDDDFAKMRVFSEAGNDYKDNATHLAVKYYRHAFDAIVNINRKLGGIPWESDGDEYSSLSHSGDVTTYDTFGRRVQSELKRLVEKERQRVEAAKEANERIEHQRKEADAWAERQRKEIIDKKNSADRYYQELIQLAGAVVDAEKKGDNKASTAALESAIEIGEQIEEIHANIIKEEIPENVKTLIDGFAKTYEEAMWKALKRKDYVVAASIADKILAANNKIDDILIFIAASYAYSATKQPDKQSQVCYRGTGDQVIEHAPKDRFIDFMNQCASDFVFDKIDFVAGFNFLHDKHCYLLKGNTEECNETDNTTDSIQRAMAHDPHDVALALTALELEGEIEKEYELAKLFLKENPSLRKTKIGTKMVKFIRKVDKERKKFDRKRKSQQPRCLEQCVTNFHSCMGHADQVCCSEFCISDTCPNNCSRWLADCRNQCID